VTTSNFTLALVTLLFFLSCNQTTEPTGDGRIVWYEGIDGVQLGQDSSTVVHLLGDPSNITPLDSLGISFEYLTGPHAGLVISVYPTPGPHGSGVHTVLAKAPFTGQTDKGIGIQSTRQQVHDRYGTPSDAREFFDWYIRDSIMTVLNYESDVVNLIAVAKIDE